MELRVRFVETDQMGVVHHSAYVPWLEAGRVEWLRERGLSYREMEDGGMSLAVAHVEVSYRAACYFDDLLEVASTLTDVRSRRVGFAYRITRPADAVLIATATTSHVPTGRDGRAMRIPERWLAPMTLLLESNP
ncbi:MAG: thioesterase family protein [Trueperaceae bacterium]|jgi:acyl-CoA thioester hydrolase|nr:thioesterase family protein [Truepera sp.]HRN18874.1 thioesterase family protein [Trueperaceae bacterium]HRQ10361.1 thioesterase family protein [Trueperaceae bacterium]